MSAWCNEKWKNMTAEQAVAGYGVISGKAICPDCGREVKLSARPTMVLGPQNASPLHVVFGRQCINVTESILDDLMWQDHQYLNHTDLVRLQQYVAADILTRDCINRLTAV